MRLSTRLVRIGRRLLGDRRGNVAMILGLCALPLAVMVGFTVDLVRQQTASQDAQSSVDHSALAAAISRAKDRDELQLIVDDYMAANLDTRYLGKDYDVVVDYNDQKQIVVTLRGQIDAFFSGLIGRPTLPINVSVTAVRGTSDAVEVALVLDNTWSMSDSDGSGRTRIAALKSASRILVNELMVQEEAPVRLGIVPYADYVNVGTGNRYEPWMSVQADYSVTPKPKVCENKPVERNKCSGAVAIPSTCESTIDGVKSSYSCTKYDRSNEVCKKETKIEEVCSGGGSPTNYRWYGCVASRKNGTLRLNDTRPEFQYVGMLDTSQRCLNPILPLTNQKSQILSTIDNLIINIGNYKPETHIPSGMIWGVNVLSPSAPFTQGADYHPGNRDPRKILVLMTDGDNTRRFRPGDGFHVGATNANRYAAEMAETNRDVSDICTYAKSKNIEIYTVGLNVPTAAGRSMLEACASSNEHAFNANDSESLETAFRDIATSINKVRLIR